MEEAREGVSGGVNSARLLVTSAEFRDELVEGLGVIQQSLRRGGERPATVGPERETTTQGGEERGYYEEGYDEEEEEEEAETGGGVAGTTKGGYQPLSQNQIDKVAHRFVHLMKRVQHKPEFQDSLRFLLERLRTAFEMGGLHAERMERQLQESEAGRAFLAETADAKVQHE